MKKVIIFLLFISVSLFFGATPAGAQTVTADLKVNGSDGPLSLTAPASFTLTWNSSNATSCMAGGSWSGSRGTFGSETYANVPANIYTYTISCTNGASSMTDSVTVTTSNTQTLSVSCSAYPNPATPNQLITFSSSVSGGSGSYSYLWSGACYGSGSSCSQSFGSSGNYGATVSVTSGSQTQSGSCSANVTGGTPSSNVDLKVNGSNGPLSLASPASYVLSWTSNNASYCSASGNWSGTKNTAGSETQSNIFQGTYVYAITCNNRGSDSVTVTVGQGQGTGFAPVASISVEPRSGATPATTIFLDGSRSYDPNGSIAWYIWREGLDLLGTGPTVSRQFSAGTHAITLHVIDNSGLIDEETAAFTVNPFEEVPAPIPPVAPIGGESILITAPDQQQADVCKTTRVPFTVANGSGGARDIVLELGGSAERFADLPTNIVRLASGESRQIRAYLEIPCNLSQAEKSRPFILTVAARSGSDAASSATDILLAENGRQLYSANISYAAAIEPTGFGVVLLIILLIIANIFLWVHLLRSRE